MPFENLTKIIKFHEGERDPEQAIRLPAEVLRDHREHGTGATCFALVFLLRDLIQRAGHSADLTTCDRRYGPDTHAAVVMEWQGTRWLFDPGFYICQPLPEQGEACFRTPLNPNVSRVVRRPAGRCDCFTGHQKEWRYRFTLKDVPLTEAEYKRRWVASFQADMMGYPVLNRFEGGRMIYLQKSNLVVRDLTSGHVEKLRTSHLADAIREHYGIAPAVVKRALDIVKRS